MLNVALPKGRLGDKVYRLFKAAGYDCAAMEQDDRRLVLTDEKGDMSYLLVKPSDVAIYVERGAADMGVAGRDILLEYSPDVYELLDLGIGRCRMCVAGREERLRGAGTLRVATKFPSIATRYFRGRGRAIDIIRLNGSIELAPIIGLSDVIVDIVETGTTLRENDLSVLETILPISARLIANKASFKFKYEGISRLKKLIAEAAEGGKAR